VLQPSPLKKESHPDIKAKVKANKVWIGYLDGRNLG
jgi:hypothetical protein